MEPDNAARIASMISPVDPWPVLTEGLNAMEHFDHAYLGPRRKLERGDEADVRFNGAKQRTRARFHHADEHGNLTFVDPRRNAMRTVKPDAVGTIHRKTKLRGASE